MNNSTNSTFNYDVRERGVQPTINNLFTKKMREPPPRKVPLPPSSTKPENSVFAALAATNTNIPNKNTISVNSTSSNSTSNARLRAEPYPATLIKQSKNQTYKDQYIDDYTSNTTTTTNNTTTTAIANPFATARHQAKGIDATRSRVQSKNNEIMNNVYIPTNAPKHVAAVNNAYSSQVDHSMDNVVLPSKSRTARNLPAGFGQNSNNNNNKSNYNSNRGSNFSRFNSSNTFASNLTKQTQAFRLEQEQNDEQVQLTAEQLRVMDLVVKNKANVFFTGSAGTGKSLLLRRIIKKLKSMYGEANAVAITAPTALAGFNIGGHTIHSWAGVGLGEQPAAELNNIITKNKNKLVKWKKAKVLIIDEVSMLDGFLFQKLEELGRTVRNDYRPFGGIQVVLCGDFFQLPPVSKNNSSRFVFEMPAWGQVLQHTIRLTQVFRQSDSNFVRLLNELRSGRLSIQSERTLLSLDREIVYDDGIKATELYPRREEVDRANRQQLNRLPGALLKYNATDFVEGIQDYEKPRYLQQLDRNCMAPSVLELKKDAQVMLIRNLDKTLINGLLGKVVDFNSSGHPVVQFINGVVSTIDKFDFKYPVGDKRLIRRMQYPLLLAWALSIHKAQGQTLHRVKVDLGSIFEKGQAYVALSRATGLEGLQVVNFTRKAIMCHEKVVQFYNRLTDLNSEEDDGGDAPVAVVNRSSIGNTATATTTNSQYRLEEDGIEFVNAVDDDEDDDDEDLY